ncbi:undecaprenyl-diphosphate phosphatase [Geminicoccaceae bacterium 1502E]|nr:undecaprenyl-diphosphate phosphatase [Geminicoccaceae bacterium 1502E]
MLEAALLGIVEGLTEFLPVSSTGHLILVGWLIDFNGPPGKVFEVVIQLGAILAICALYFTRLLKVVLDLPRRPEARRFVLSILVAFLPAVVLGVTLHGYIKAVLFSPWVVVVALVTGGIAILLIERLAIEPRHHSAEALPIGTALRIGLCQTLAMVPGVSRSGATILGAVVMGVDRRAAAEFSFFLAIPTMLGATVYDLYKNHGALDPGDFWLMAAGFAMALLTALVVVRALLAFLARHSFEVFGWYRIVLGLVMAVALLAGS